MGDLPAPLGYLLMTWGVITSMLVILLIYRATLSSREDDQIFLSKTEDQMMATEQREIIDRMNRLGRPILALAVLSGILLLSCAGVWLWGGLKSF
jgi:hypothetical protein